MDNKEAVIFDLDGTIIDSNKHTFYFLKKVIGNNSISDDEILNLKKYITGKSIAEMSQVFQSLYLPNMDVQKIESKIHAVSGPIYKNKVKFFKGFERYHDLVAQHYKTAIATSLPRELVDIVDDSLDLKFFFHDNILSLTDDKKYQDPFDPSSKTELFKATADKLKVKPEECIVYEDSITGIESAIRAGMHPILIMHGASDMQILEAASMMRKKGIIGIYNSFPSYVERKVDIMNYNLN